MNKITFLKDVLICSLGAYGGPSAHYGVFTDQMVVKKKYLNEKELVELIALNSILPGPTSTQTIVSIGYKVGGPSLAFLTMLVWAVPALIFMTTLSFLYAILVKLNLNLEGLRFIGPMAVGFIIVAAYRINKKVLTNRMTWILMFSSALITYFVRVPWIYPLVLMSGGIIAYIFSKDEKRHEKIKLKPPYLYLILFILFAGGSIAMKLFFNVHLLDLFESFFRYGYLVFGGGQVVIPVMHSDLVEIHQFMTSAEFLTGYGLVQGIPGPMFSFSAYAGGMAARGVSVYYQIAGALLSGIGIFLPGLLLIFFVYPIWEKLKTLQLIQLALIGINGVAGGLIIVSAIILTEKSGITFINLMVTLITVVLLFTKKIPSPLLVVGTIVLGFML
ncbi:MAG: chromate efflux transporter [Clostridia bacterium]|nr:chromate efflux transporter [Clostridia bacterium]